jgi:hypothetical protein
MDPGDGSINVADKATIANDTTITSGKLIFNTADVGLSQQAGGNLWLGNKAGTGGANLKVGMPAGGVTTITPHNITIRKLGSQAIDDNLGLEVYGNTSIQGQSSSSVTLKVGTADIQFNGTNLVLNKPTGGVVQYNDDSTIEEVATQGFVNAQLGKALTGDSATLTTLLSNLSTLVSGNPVQAIAATTCGFYTNMTWNGTRCVDNREDDCPANQMMIGFTGGRPNCIFHARLSQGCDAGQVLNGFFADGTVACDTVDNRVGGFVDTKIDAAIRAERARTVCTGGTASGLCIVNGTSCPSGTSRVGNWGTTTSNRICGGSTTGCNSCKNTCDTGGHGFSNTATESCCAGTVVACGPATSGETCGSATLTQVGCTMP